MKNMVYKTLALIVIFISIFIAKVFAQGSCLTNNLNFYTNSTDWILISNTYGVANNVNAQIPLPQLNTISSSPSAQWISHQANWILYGTLNDPDDNATFRYQFKTCGTDSIGLNFVFRRDNYCKILLDGNVIFTESPTDTSDNYYIGTTFNKKYLLNQGTHNIDFIVYNVYPYTGNNGVGGIMGGVITSQNQNSIIINSPACANASCCNLNLQIAGNINICPGQSTTLTASGATNYVWSGGINNGVAFTPTASGTYTVTASDANGCTATSTVFVNLGGLNVNITNPNPIICSKDSTLLTVSGAINYTWLPSSSVSVNNSTSFWAKPNATTTYTVTGTDASGCTGTSSIDIKVVTSIDVKASKTNDIDCKHPSAQLNATGGINYLWSPASGLNNPTISNPIAEVNTTTTFYVTGNIGSCVDSDSITVINEGGESNKYFLPNAFSPNDDGKNDCFKILTKGSFKTFYVAIYNRYGQRIFESNRTDFCWDGYFKGVPAIMGTYYYYLKGENSCGKFFEKGDITLIR